MSSEVTKCGILCEGIQMTPEQSNEVIEEKLRHLAPVFECALAEMLRVRDALFNGEISWRCLLDRARATLDQ